MKWILVIVGGLAMMIPPVSVDFPKIDISFWVGLSLIFGGIIMFLGGLWWILI
ncbi:hypothetical protein LCGC14_2561650 [marine sediment metagenome]|uniref:Uncharacterized protein n=1 Tax=marine sediment metagenome TaxID=412755 RepID=A0A0F9DD00_9ZZZZ